ncbi:hypothetical protein IE4872_PD00125 (plasmid) [Rhizobium gallicum]|uniref:Uncharacterized protein n=1 Tax=Rhizobium gallicum TaxID=56730 RepID=A0A1L5NS17_9HYPH|nr:hypothetical protein IE4872_PD00125 [Rhizobium gallicum]
MRGQNQSTIDKRWLSMIEISASNHQTQRKQWTISLLVNGMFTMISGGYSSRQLSISLLPPSSDAAIAIAAPR